MPALNCSNHLLFRLMASSHRTRPDLCNVSFAFSSSYLLKEDDIKTGRLSPLLLFDFFFFQIFLIDIARQRSASYTPFPPFPSSRNEIGSPKRTKSGEKLCNRTYPRRAFITYASLGGGGGLGKPRMELAMDRGGGRQRYSSRIKLGRYGCAL